MFKYIISIIVILLMVNCQGPVKQVITRVNHLPTKEKEIGGGLNDAQRAELEDKKKTPQIINKNIVLENSYKIQVEL